LNAPRKPAALRQATSKLTSINKSLPSSEYLNLGWLDPMLVEPNAHRGDPFGKIRRGALSS